jgi:serine phosphatase RsbU (regulator of sigma subunit)/putative methionine-R-sulfoxide reductase with GAF domain
VSRVVLKQLLARSADTRALIDAMAAAVGPLAVEDPQGRHLHGTPADGEAFRFAVRHDDTHLGAVVGEPPAGLLADLLSHLAGREGERKSLGTEVLNLYREINLIYSFSEKLAALLDVERVAALTLQEARRLIVATDGVLMLLDHETGALTTVAGFGDELPALQGFHAGRGILGAVAASGVAEIVNDIADDPRRVTEQTALRALLGAALRVGERVTGIIVLGSTVPMAYTAGELKLLNTLALQAATAIENARLFERTVQAAQERERLLQLNKAAEVARAKLESELVLAARIQAALFPATLPAVSGYDLAARNRPARQCGGDYYDAIAVPGGDDGRGSVLLCVADVSGKGLPASLVMANMQATLRALLGRTASLPALAAEASDLLFASTSPEKYVTAALVDLEPRSGALRVVSAGHVDTFILRASGDVVTLSSSGTPLGLMPPGLPFGETMRHLDAGDTLVLFSDGVPEAQNIFDEEFGEDRLIDVLREAAADSADQVIDRVMAAIDAFVGGAPQFDDITLLVVRRQRAG